MTDLTPIIEKHLARLTEFRHELHAHPEPGFQEHETAARILSILEPIENMAIRTGLAGTGIAATLNSDRTGPCIALRADMDALPIEEQTGKPYASTNGFMHACGHDGNVACLVGAALVLAEIRNELPGPIRFIFQPSEEGGGGGKLVCQEGVLEMPQVDAVFALHAWPTLPVGAVGTRAGPSMASTDTIHIVVRGKGSHAAYPHEAVDPILIAAHIVTALQSVVSRSLHPADPAVVTIAQIQAGTACNIIPETATLTGTLRTLSESVRVEARERIKQLVAGTATAYGGEADIRLEEGYPVLVNNPAATAFVDQTARAILGDSCLQQNLQASLGGEDFAYYLQRVPGALWRLGIRPPDADEMAPLHNAQFDFNDDAIPIGVRMHCELVRRFPAHGLEGA